MRTLLKLVLLQKITDKYITTQHISSLNITSLGEVTAGSFSLGNRNFVVDSYGNLTANNATINGKVTSSSLGKKIIIDPVTSSLKFEDELGEVRAAMGFNDLDVDNKHTYLSLDNAPSPNVRHKALLKPGYQELSSDYYGGAGNVTTILSDCFNSILKISQSGRYGSSGTVKATANSGSGGFLEIVRVGPSTAGDITKTEISPTNLKITDSSSNTCEIKVDGMYINGTKSPASMITAGTFTGIVKAFKTILLIQLSKSGIWYYQQGNAVSSQMANGDIWIKYE